MIPHQMDTFLRDVLLERTWERRLRRAGPLAFMEFGALDVDRLQSLGIEPDNLGPYRVVCMWDVESPLEIGGYLVVDNLSMGRPSMGGIRMMPTVTPATIHNLARGMTLKNAAANLPFGGGKSGIVAPSRKLSRAEHRQIVQGFARLIGNYQDIYLPGPDVGTNDDDMKTIAIENGLNGALSKTADMGGNRIDQLGAAAQGVVVGIETLMEEMERLKVLPQFADLDVPKREDLTVLIQGFGAVGTHAARLLTEKYPERPPKITGISDAGGYIYDPDGLPVMELLALQEQQGIVALPYFQRQMGEDGDCKIKFSNNCDDLLRESAYCLIPAAPVGNYLDVEAASNPCMTVDRMGEWRLVVEGANTYSPARERRAARRRMERTVYWQKGVLIATDFLVNSGGVIFAAQERLIPPPEHLQIPNAVLGDRRAVEGWLQEHQAEFAALGERRRTAGRVMLEAVIRRNMRELIDLLVADSDMLPSEAAELIAINRITAGESGRTVADVMAPIPTIARSKSMREAARLLIEEQGDLVAVVDASGSICGVVTDRDITEAMANSFASDTPVTRIMSGQVISCCDQDPILDVVRKLELYEISAMPVLERNQAIGLISSDILARRTLYRLLQAG
ncbi:MAG: Glu/Leu/Phe/Val dehydrogenase dimerization domain-containing protein [Candidatus Promineifilaceae bacterium]|nr:Glu/Leu/Phe/Val dehydrogenase dimerization domain-containing protein [Candidatus Promineifilaceae bacterium]